MRWPCPETRRILMANYHNNPDDALRSGNGKKALGDIIVDAAGPIATRRMIVVYERGKDPYLAYPGSPGVPIRRATSREVERAYRWRNVMNSAR